MRAQESARTGAAVRKLRLARGWTLAELSSHTGVPLSTLSRVELGQNGLKYEVLMRVCRALEVDLQGMVALQADTLSMASGRRSVTRRCEGRRIRLAANEGRLAADELTERTLTPIFVSVTARDLDAHGAFATLPSEAHLLVLSGTVTLHSQFYAPTELRAGDSVYFDARSGFALVSNVDTSSEVLLTVAGHPDL